MGASKLSMLMVLVLVLVLVTNLSTQKIRAVEGRLLSSSSSASSSPSSTTQRYLKIFSTLGMMCECCDGVGGECTSKWNLSCSNLQCSPWKSH